MSRVLRSRWLSNRKNRRPRGLSGGCLWAGHRLNTTPRLNAKSPIILYMTTIPIATARANLSQLVEEASSTHERVEITKNGQRAAVLLGADDYDSMMETIAVLSDSDLLVAHLRGLEEIEAGDVVDAGALATLLNETGQLRGPG